MSNHKTTEKKITFLSLFSAFALIYFTIKFIVFPLVDHKENKTIPDINFPDVTLLVIIFLFQPQTLQTLKNLRPSREELTKEFTALKRTIEENKQEIDKLQYNQVDKIQQIVQYMYPLIISSAEVKILKEIKKHNEYKTSYKFDINQDTVVNLRRLRDSKLIKIKLPYRYISDLEKASDYAKTKKDLIDLAKCCEITGEGIEFLDNLQEIVGNSKTLTPLIEAEKK